MNNYKATNEERQYVSKLLRVINDLDSTIPTNDDKYYASASLYKSNIKKINSTVQIIFGWYRGHYSLYGDQYNMQEDTTKESYNKALKGLEEVIEILLAD